jgi:hypothetical protein
MMRAWKRVGLSLATVGGIAAGVVPACGKSSSSNSATTVSDPEPTPADNTNTATNTDNKTAVAVGQLALSVPSDLVLDSPFNAETPAMALSAKTEAAAAVQAGQVAVSSTLKLDAGACGKAPAGPAEKKLQTIKLTYAAKDIASCIYRPPQPPAPGDVPCYGPALSFVNNPDGFADGEVYGRGDLGIVFPLTADGQACVAAKMNSEIDKVSFEVDQAIGTAGMLACIARVLGSGLPEKGATLDLAPAAKKAAEADPYAPVVTNAKVERLDDVDGHPVYLTQFTVGEGTQLCGEPDPNHVPRTRKIFVKHSPQDGTNTTYKGKLWIRSDVANVPDDLKSGCNRTTDKQTTALSIVYNKISDTSLRYEMRASRWMPYVTDDQIFDKHSYANPPATCDMGADYALFDLNPQDGTGKVAYSWIAGQAGENTRSFVSNVTNDGTTKSGCGHYSFGKTLTELYAERAAKTSGDSLDGFIDRFICAWSHNPGTIPPTYPMAVQRQCMTQDDAGRFTPTSTHIAFSPQVACQTNDPSSTYTLTVIDPDGPGPQPGGQTIHPPATHDLLPIVDAYGTGQDQTNAVLRSEVTSPAIPADIDP